MTPYMKHYASSGQHTQLYYCKMTHLHMHTPGLFFSLTHAHMLQMSWYKKTFMSIWRHPTTEMFAIFFMLCSLPPCSEIDFESSGCVLVLSLSHKEYVLFSRQCVFFINAHSHYYRPTEQNLPQREDLERLESFFLFSACLLPYREHWIWSYDCRESVADRHIAGHCQLSNHPSHCSLALDYPNCSWCQQQASCSEEYAG